MNKKSCFTSEHRIKSSCDYHDSNHSQEQLFINAVIANDLESVKDFLVKGVDVNFKPLNTWNAIVCASLSGNSELIELLLSHGADINSSHKNLTAVLALCISPCSEEDRLLNSLDLLLSHGAEVNQTNSSGVSAVSLAVINKHEKLIIKLINEGADINKVDEDGWSPLFYAVGTGNLLFISLLKDYNADIHIRDKRCQTLIDIASKQDNKDEIIELLNSSFNGKLIPCEEVGRPTPRLFDIVTNSLPFKDDRLSGFPEYVLAILLSKNLTYLRTEFSESKLGLGHVLTADEEWLKKNGVHFWFERHNILIAAETFYVFPGDLSAVDYIHRFYELDYLTLRVMPIVIRLIYLVSVASFNWSKQRRLNPLEDTVADISNLKSTLSSIRDLRKKFKLLQNIFSGINKKCCTVPPDFIPPQKNSHRFNMNTLVLISFIGGFYFALKHKVKM